MKKIRNYPQFTHFACLPFIQQVQRNIIQQIHLKIKEKVKNYPQENFIESNFNLAHVTISMLTLHRQEMRQKMYQISQKIAQSIQNIMSDVNLTFQTINYFVKFNPKNKKSEVSLVYLKLQKDKDYQKVAKLTDFFIRQMLQNQLVTSEQLKQMRIVYDHKQNSFKTEEHHLSLFRVKNVQDNQQWRKIFQQIQEELKCRNIQFKCRSFDVCSRDSFRQQNSFYQTLYSVPLEALKLLKQNKV